MTRLDIIIAILLLIFTMFVIVGNIVIKDVATTMLSLPPYAIAWYFFVKYVKRLQR